MSMPMKVLKIPIKFKHGYNFSNIQDIEVVQMGNLTVSGSTRQSMADMIAADANTHAIYLIECGTSVSDVTFAGEWKVDITMKNGVVVRFTCIGDAASPSDEVVEASKVVGHYYSK